MATGEYPPPHPNGPVPHVPFAWCVCDDCLRRQREADSASGAAS